MRHEFEKNPPRVLAAPGHSGPPQTHVMSAETLAHLGEGPIAYVKQIKSDDVPRLFPQAPPIAPGLQLYALHGADGTPIMLTDSREAALANAWSQELQAVSVH